MKLIALQKHRMFIVCFAISFWTIATNAFDVRPAIAQPTAFTPGDIYLLSEIIPDVDEAIIRIDPSSGATSLLVDLNARPVSSLSYDAYREMLIVMVSGAIRGVRPSGEVVVIEGDVLRFPGFFFPSLSAARGDGLLYFYNGYNQGGATGFFYIDRDGAVHVLPGARFGSELAIDALYEMFYDSNTNAIYFAASLFRNTNEAVVAKLPLNEQGTAVQDRQTLEVGLTKRVVGLGAGPDGRLFLAGETKMVTFDGETMDGLSLYAETGRRGDGRFLAVGAGVFSDNRALMHDSNNNVIWEFNEGDGGVVEEDQLFASGVSAEGTFDEAANMIVIIEGGPTNEPTPSITISPASHDYGNVFVGSGVSQSFTVANTGTASLEVNSIEVFDLNPDHFKLLDGSGPFTLGVGESRSIPVLFAPTSIGMKVATIRFDSNDPVESPLDIPISGNGIEGDGQCLTAPSGLLSWWPGDGNTVDIHLGNDGTLVGGTTFTSGKVGDAFSVDGLDDYVEIPNNGGRYDFGATESFSWAAWFTTTASGGIQTILSKEDGDRPTFNSLVLSDGRVTAAVQPNQGGTFTATSTGTYNDGVFHHIAGIVDRTSNAVTLIVDGGFEVVTESFPANSTFIELQTNV